jgi:hypothetical protein
MGELKMNYDTRIAIAREWVGNLITRYERPAHLAHEKARLELADMAEDLNAIIPSKLNAEEYRSILDKAARTIRAKNRTRSWPTIALVCQAVRENLPTPAPSGQASAAPKSLDRTRSMVINAGRIKRREPVGQSWITGTDADKLIAQNLIERADLKPYLDAIEADAAARAAEIERGSERLKPAARWQPDLAQRLDELSW